MASERADEGIASEFESRSHAFSRPSFIKRDLSQTETSVRRDSPAAARCSLFIATMASAKVRIAARLRPRIDGELDDESVKIIHPLNTTGGSSSSTAGSSFITVANPRDPSQIFKFP